MSERKNVLALANKIALPMGKIKYGDPEYKALDVVCTDAMADVGVVLESTEHPQTAEEVAKNAENRWKKPKRTCGICRLRVSVFSIPATASTVTGCRSGFPASLK